jgi:hypothetical protein
MKLVTRTRVVFVLSLSSIFADPGPKSDPASVPSEPALVSYFLDAVGKILDANNKLWTKLGKDQALSVVRQMSTDTANLEIKKNDLIQLLGTNQSDTFHKQLAQIKQDIDRLKRDILKFSTEIDVAAPQTGADLRLYVSRVETEKVIELSSIHFPLPTDQPGIEKAKGQLNQAISDLKLMRNALDCLAQTITTGIKTCDPSKLPADPTPNKN